MIVHDVSTFHFLENKTKLLRGFSELFNDGVMFKRYKIKVVGLSTGHILGNLGIKINYHSSGP